MRMMTLTPTEIKIIKRMHDDTDTDGGKLSEKDLLQGDFQDFLNPLPLDSDKQAFLQKLGELGMLDK